MKKVLLIVCLIGSVLGCGRRQPVITQPADGQTINLTPGSYFDVTLESYDQYEGTTIEFRGITAELAKELSCQNATNGPARCAVIYNPQNFGQFSGTGFQNSWTVVVIVRRDTFADVRTVNVVRPTYQSGVNQPIFPKTSK